MRELSPGDVIFSFVGTRIAAIGIAQSYWREGPKPAEFGQAGQNWENVGWKVKVVFTTILKKVRPKDYMEVLRTGLPGRYSPLQANGNGNQSIYLVEISTVFAEVPADLIGQEARPLISAAGVAGTRVADRAMPGGDIDVCPRGSQRFWCCWWNRDQNHRLLAAGEKAPPPAVGSSGG